MAARKWLTGLLVAGSVAVSVPARADDDAKGKEDSAEKTDDEKSADADTEKKDADTDSEKAGDKEGKEATAGAAAADSVVEEKGKTYRFVGARYRLILVPKFIVSLFADGGATVAVHSFGPEFAIRKDGFEYNFGLTYAGYGMSDTPFKSKSDGEDAWELVNSQIKVLYLTADFLWSHELSPQFAINYGMGAGLGLVFGTLYRNQAIKTGSGYTRCAGNGRGGPAAPSFYCGTDNNHYDNYEEPSWANGGSKPVIFPWLAVQTGARYKVDPRFVARLDVGFGLSGFFFGLGADYGL
jgi:hypothetical protein